MRIECAFNPHVRTINVKVPNRIECALSQSTSVCGLNAVRSGLKWNVGGLSLRHMTSVHRYGDEGFVGYTGGDADVKTQLDEIIKNKVICQKVANAVAERGYSRTRESVDLVATNLHLL